MARLGTNKGCTCEHLATLSPFSRFMRTDHNEGCEVAPRKVSVLTSYAKPEDRFRTTFQNEYAQHASNDMLKDVTF